MGVLGFRGLEFRGLEFKGLGFRGLGFLGAVARFSTSTPRAGRLAVFDPTKLSKPDEL